MKEGYKETEIGVIPEEWEVSYLNDFGDIVSGGTPRTNVREYWEGGIAWCTPSDITQTCGKYISETNKTITELGLKNSSANLLPEGTILLCTRATIGELKISRIPMATNQGFKNILLNTPNNVDYLYYLLQTKKNDMIELAIGTTFLEISKAALCKIPLQTPPIIEQQNIAEVLSDIDGLISSLEKVIEKKKAIKQACLQKMFPKNGETTPEMRLPGFTEPWEQRRLGDMTIYRNGTGHEDMQSGNGQYELVNLNSVSIDGGLKPSGRFIDEANETLIVNDLVMILSDVGHGDLLGRVAIIPENNRFVLNQRVALLRPNETVYPKFLLVCINVHQKYFKVNGAGSSQLNISKDTVENFSPYVPNISEQKVIAKYFENLDHLITLHERKLEKYKKIKQGMMQQLLTGKIRLL